MERLLTIITQHRRIIHKLVHTIIDRTEDMVSRNKYVPISSSLKSRYGTFLTGICLCFCNTAEQYCIYFKRKNKMQPQSEFYS